MASPRADLREYNYDWVRPKAPSTSIGVRPVLQPGPVHGPDEVFSALRQVPSRYSGAPSSAPAAAMEQASPTASALRRAMTSTPETIRVPAAQPAFNITAEARALAQNPEMYATIARRGLTLGGLARGLLAPEVVIPQLAGTAAGTAIYNKMPQRYQDRVGQFINSGMRRVGLGVDDTAYRQVYGQ